MQQCLNLFHSTSPSYPLLVSLELAALHWPTELGQSQLDTFLKRSQRLRDSLGSCHPALKQMVFKPTEQDMSRLYLRWGDHDPQDWANRMETEQGLVYESLSPYGCLYFLSPWLSEADFEALETGLRTLTHLNPETSAPSVILKPDLPPVETLTTPRSAFFAKGECVQASKAVGRLAKETVVRCPPGLPFLIPGEMVQPEHLPYLPENLWVVS
jgi:arginine decarboxylase